MGGMCALSQTLSLSSMQYSSPLSQTPLILKPGNTFVESGSVGIRIPVNHGIQRPYDQTAAELVAMRVHCQCAE